MAIHKPETPTTKIIEDDGLFKEELPLLMGLIRLFPWRSRVASDLIAVLRDITVGRGAECDMVIDEDSVSRLHADVRKTGSGALEVIDRGSSNGTFVVERRIEGSALAATGDLVRFGRCLFRVVSTAPLYQGWWSQGSRTPIIGGPAMGDVRQTVRRFGAMDNPVLITGETGTGKEVVASELHRVSGRHGPFVAVNCAAVPDNLFEDQFFGHQRGAFTGADRSEAGFFMAASRGTIFLDEVGELSPPTQSKLLRVLETRQVIPLGATKPEPMTARVVAATNRDLADAVERGDFRADLYTRLRVLTVPLTPIRERLEDVAMLSQHFLKGSEVDTMKHDALVSFMQYSWPGNARELKNVLVEAVAKAVAEGSSSVARRHLRPEFQRSSEPPSRGVHLEGTARTDAVLAAMRRFKGNISHAAKDLGLHRAQIYKVLKETDHSPDDFRN